MDEDLLAGFERERRLLLEEGPRFAQRFPAIAGQLALPGQEMADPHVERLLEAFALLSARVHRRLDDGLPWLAEDLLERYHPAFARPFPSASIAQLLPAGIRGTVPRHTLLRSRPLRGVSCLFRTCHAVELRPLEVTGASLDPAPRASRVPFPGTRAVLELDLRVLAPAPGSGLRFFLDGDPPLMHLLHDLLHGGALGFTLEGDATAAPLRRGPEGLRPGGFDPGEGLWDDGPRSPQGSRLLMEYFAFPEKFLFTEFLGVGDLDPGTFRLSCSLRRLPETEAASRLLRNLGPSTFRPGCVPVVNLFPRAGDPLTLDHRRVDLPITPGEACELFDVEGVTLAEGGGPPRRVPPLLEAGEGRFAWHMNRATGRTPTLTLLDRAFQAPRQAPEVLGLDLLCTQGDLARDPERGGPGMELSLPPSSPAPLARLLRSPTPCLRPPPLRARRRLLSLLAGNALPLASRERLQEILALHDGTGSPAGGDRIRAIRRVEASPARARFPGRTFSTEIRGLQVDITLEEGPFTGSSAALFGSVLEGYFASLCPPNTFVKVRILVPGQEGGVPTWHPFRPPWI